MMLATPDVKERARVKSKRDQCVEVAAEMMSLMNTSHVRRFNILDRRYKRLITSLDSIEDVDYVLEELRRRFPKENKPGGILSA